MMSLVKMKLAVCEKLPELIKVSRIPLYIGWNTPNGIGVHWPTEGLQVCHEAEKLLTADEWIKYRNGIAHILRGREYLVHATYEQRLEALCRVWFPEKFN